MQVDQFDYVIVGAGPAGLQLGYFLQKAGRNYVILESSDAPGASFKTFPRHRKLISANKVYTGYSDPVRNLRWDWNSLISDNESLLFKHYSREYFPAADDLVRYLRDFAVGHGLNVHYGQRVERVSRDGTFKVQCESGRHYEGARLVMATGVSQPYLPAVPGIDLVERYVDASVDPEDFADQRVLIVGKGNSAFETADNLIATASRIYVCSPTPITLSWKSKFVGHLRAVNNNFVDTYQLKLQNVMLDAEVVSIEKVGNVFSVTFHYKHADDEVETMQFDRVIVCTGFRFDASMFDEDCRPALAIKDRFPAQTSAFESTNVKDLFFAGTVMQERDYRKKQSGFIHGFRHNIESLSRYFEQRYHGRPWPHRTIDATPAALAASVLERANRSPGLWQQTGFLCDVLVRSSDGRSFLYYEDLAVQYVHESEFRDFDEYHVVTLEFGLDIIYASPDPLAVTRIHKDDVDGAHQSTGIHPIVRHYSRGKLVAEHHVLEDIIPEWDDADSHVSPLERHFARTVGMTASAEPVAFSTTIEGVVIHT